MENDLEAQQVERQSHEKAESERAAERLAERMAHMRAQESQQQAPEQKTLADTPAPELPATEKQRGGMERELSLDNGLRQDTASWMVEGLKLQADLQAAGMGPARSLADEPAPDLQKTQAQQEHEQQRQQEREQER